MSVITILILLAILAIVERLIKPKIKKSKFPKKESKVSIEAQVFNENINAATLLRSEEYIERMRRFNNRCYKNLTGQNRVNHYGEEGELIVLGHCELVGKSAVYSNVGLVHNGDKCEIDILALSKYGLVHVEVKNFSGCYFPADDCTCYRPEKWQKKWNGNVNVLRSPVIQAERACDLLSEALPAIINEHIPIFSVIVFTDKTFKLSRVAEDRMVMCSVDTFQEVFDEFVNGRNPEFLKKIDPLGAAKFLAELKGNGMYPVFYAPETFRCYR